MAKIPKEYAERVFRVTPARLFTDSETAILERYGHWMNALASGALAPTTEAQARFVRVAHGEAEAESAYERAWAKYVARKRWEAENPDFVGARGVQMADPG